MFKTYRLILFNYHKLLLELSTESIVRIWETFSTLHGARNWGPQLSQHEPLVRTCRQTADCLLHATRGRVTACPSYCYPCGNADFQGRGAAANTSEGVPWGTVGVMAEVATESEPGRQT